MIHRLKMMQEIEGLEMSQCVICEITQKDMRLLHCYHSICPSCLTSSGGSQISCPSCGVLSSNVTNKEGKFRNNSFLEYLFEFGETKESLPNCDVCSNRGKDYIPGLHTCYQCNLSMCKGCKQSHDVFPQNKTHTVVLTIDKGIFEEGQTQQTCKAHPGKPIELFCKACQHLMCMMCSIVESSICPNGSSGKHTCIYLNNAINLKRAELREQVEAIEKELSEVKTTVETLEAKLRKVATDGASMKALILKQKAEIQKELDENTEQLLKEADGLTNSRRGILEKTLQAHRNHLDMKAALCFKLSCAVEYCSPENLQRRVEKSKAAMSIAPLVSESSFPEVVYKPNSDMSSMKRSLRESMGHLMEKEELVLPQECTYINDVAYSSFTNSFYVSGCKSGLWKMTNGYLQKIDGDICYGLCISHDGQALYSAAEGKLVRVFELTKTGPPKEVRSIKISAHTQSVCLSDGGLLAVVCGRPKSVLIYDQSKNLQKEISGACCGGQPLYGAWTGEDKLCVTVNINKGSDKVVYINTECPCVLWQVDVDECWCISFIDHLLYIGNQEGTGVEVISDGRNLGSIRSRGLRKMLPPVRGGGTGPLRAVHCYGKS